MVLCFKGWCRLVKHLVCDIGIWFFLLQNISDTVVSERAFGYSRSNMECTPNNTFTGNMFEATLPMDAGPDDIYMFCVQFNQ